MAPAVSQSLIIFPCNFPFINFSFLNPSHSFSYLQLLYFKHKAGLLSPFFCFVPQWASASTSFFLLSFCHFFLSSGQVHESERGAPVPNCHAWHILTQFTKQKKPCVYAPVFSLTWNSSCIQTAFCNSSEQVNLSNITWTIMLLFQKSVRLWFGCIRLLSLMSHITISRSKNADQMPKTNTKWC